jgi:hypothetical protein
MFESGQRLPNEATLHQLASALTLDKFAEHQLQVLADYPSRSSLPGDEWFLPEDVLCGTPIFLRDLRREAEIQKTASISEMWIVTARPLALSAPMYGMLKERVLAKASFVYFIDTAEGESSFRSLWGELSRDPELKEKEVSEKDIAARVRCVLSPPSICLQHFGICNPGRFAEMFGRLIVYAKGFPIGYMAMDPDQVKRAYHLLDPVLRDCTALPNQDVAREYGKFRLILPNFQC